MARHTEWKVSTTLEFDLTPCLTDHWEITARSAPGAAQTALKRARRAHPGTRPRSYVVVLEAVRTVEIVSTRPMPPGFRRKEAS